MSSPTTFIGSGTETDTYPGGKQLKYAFRVVDGIISDGGRVSWVCDSADINGKWKLEAIAAEDGSTMDAVMLALSGPVLNGTGHYTRL